MTYNGYKHSETFARLKRIHETIPNNLTSVEYLKTLDSLLENALYPIIMSTRFLDTFLSKILAWQSTNPKRKTTSENKRDLPSYVVLFLISSNPEQKLKIYRKIGFDRGITMEVIRRWLELMSKYDALISNPEPTLDQMKLINRLLIAVGANEDGYPYGAYLQVKFWIERTNFFKSLILEKYTRMILNTAQSDYVRFQHKIDLEDIMQVYFMAASKAIDKCDPNKGVLTTHIQHWLLSAKNVVVKNYLDTNSSSTTHKPTPESHEIIDKLLSDRDIAPEANTLMESTEDKLERTGNIDRVRQIARFFDPHGYARLTMGIGEYVTPKMREVLHQHTITVNETSKTQLTLEGSPPHVIVSTSI